MWQQFKDLFSLLFDAGKQSRQNAEEIRDLQRENRDLSAMLQALALEHQRVLGELARMHDAIQSERRESQLRIENELLKFERRLPPSNPS